MKTSLRPKIRPSEEEMADIEAERTAKRANRLKQLIEKEAEGLRDRTPMKPIGEEDAQRFGFGGDVRYNSNRGKTY